MLGMNPLREKLVTLDEIACVLAGDLAPGYYNLGFAVRVHADKGVEVLAMAPAHVLPADDIAMLQAHHTSGDGR